MKMKYLFNPVDIRERYNLHDKVTSDGYIHIKIEKRHVWLEISCHPCIRQLNQEPKTAWLYTNSWYSWMWKYETRQTHICVCINDFGIEYYSKDDITHFFSALKPTYEYTVDWEGEELHWDSSRLAL